MARPVEDKDEKGGKKGLDLSPNIVMIINNAVMIIIIIISMAIMYVLLDSKIEKMAPQTEQEQLEDGEEEVKQEGILLDLGDFILNLADVAHRRYLKVGIAIELSKTQAEIDAANTPVKASGGHGHSAPEAVDPNEAIIAEMERYKPAIRDAIISVLSNKTSDELSTPTGKEIAKEEIQQMVNSIFEGQRETMRVSFGQFIIQ